MTDTMLVPKLLLFWFSTASTRFVSHWLLGASRQQSPFTNRDAADERCLPPVCDMVNPEYSPLTVAQQYLSDILTHGSELQQILQDYVQHYGIWTQDEGHSLLLHISVTSKRCPRMHMSICTARQQRFQKRSMFIFEWICSCAGLPWIEHEKTSSLRVRVQCESCTQQVVQSSTVTEDFQL